jgi:hypothetical protein
MIVNKIKVSIEVETLNIYSIPGLLRTIVDNLNRNCLDGRMTADDGNTFEWRVDRKQVEF